METAGDLQAARQRNVQAVLIRRLGQESIVDFPGPLLQLLFELALGLVAQGARHPALLQVQLA